MRLGAAGDHSTGRKRAGHPAGALAVAVISVTGLLLSGCTSAGSPPGGGGTTALTVAAAPGVAAAPLYLAQRDGLFRAAGLSVTIQPYATVSAELAALRKGAADVAFGDYADMFYAQSVTLTGSNSAQAMDLIMDGYDASAKVMQVLTMPHSGIVRPSDLAGKVIATPPAQEMPVRSGRPYSLETLATDSVLQDEDVQPSSQPGSPGITWRPVRMPQGSAKAPLTAAQQVSETSQELLTELSTGKADAILATEPTIYEAESEFGAVPVLDSCSGSTANLPLDGYFSLHTYATRHLAELTAFRDALTRAQGMAAQSVPVRSLLKLTSVGLIPPDSAVPIEQTAALASLGTYPTSLSASDVQRVADIMFLFNALKKAISVKDMLLP